ncbi:Rubredoxin [Anaerobranca californiensis DSM 14826]|jgi:rubredoxin|uniref:Rubredoxin n=1 Tax=Anaerobranca californiensis DSM 14826 TaxID=1120989 RepID=A0A1M6NZC9_9FIRM|nr:Rubredoxin [Anaerobranca californiensis DSM 14826]
MLSKWECTICGYVYDPEVGEEGVAEPGTSFADLPEDYLCPECGVGKEYFEELA